MSDIFTDQTKFPDPLKVFDTLGGSSVTTIVNKGQRNEIEVIPVMFNEHAEPASTIQAVVGSGTIVGQIFKASQDNINSLVLTLESQLGGVSGVDIIEGYASDVALQSGWVGSTDLPVIENSLVSPNNGSTQSMKIMLDTLLNTVTKTVSATDLTNAIFALDYMSTDNPDKVVVSFFVGDGTNTKSITLNGFKDTWKNFSFLETSMMDDGVTTPNMAAITKIGFRVDLEKIGKFGYIDNVYVSTSAGQVELKLFDMGAIIPTSGVTPLASGTQYSQLNGASSGITFDLSPGKRIISFNEFTAGLERHKASNILLTPNNYYALTINYVDVNINVYGCDPADAIANGEPFYNNGWAFTAASEAAAINQISANNDLMFVVGHTQTARILDVKISGDDDFPVGASIIVLNEDIVKDIANMFNVHKFSGTNNIITLSYAERPLEISLGSKLELYYNDDGILASELSRIETYVRYLYTQTTING